MEIKKQQLLLNRPSMSTRWDQVTNAAIQSSLLLILDVQNDIYFIYVVLLHLTNLGDLRKRDDDIGSFLLRIDVEISILHGGDDVRDVIGQS